MQSIDILNKVPMIVDWPATWSKIELFNTCHWKFWLQEGSKFVTGKADIPFTTNRAMQLGEDKHALYESAARIWSDNQYLPVSIHRNPLWNIEVGEVLSDLMATFHHVAIEEKIGIDSTWDTWSLGNYWNPDRTAFGNRKMLLRTKMDIALFDKPENPSHAVIVDYKSGKVRKPEGRGQLALYALATFLERPTLRTITCEYIFVDHNTYYEETYTIQHVPELKKFFVEKILTIQRYLEAAQKRIPVDDATPGNCHWCAATKEQCEHRG